MSAIQAKNNYIGRDCQRMNCAQSVISAFKEDFDIEEDLVEAFGSYGGGRAPGGMCGAYFAAKYILGRKYPEKQEELEEYFLKQAGALDCGNIKELKKLSCVGCVEKGSEFLEKLG